MRAQRLLCGLRQAAQHAVQGWQHSFQQRLVPPVHRDTHTHSKKVTFQLTRNTRARKVQVRLYYVVSGVVPSTRVGVGVFLQTEG